MVWTIDILPSAAKDISCLHPQMQKRVLRALNSLRENPYSSQQVKALKGQDAFRLRVGEYRVVYRLENDRMVVVVIEVGTRSSIY